MRYLLATIGFSLLSISAYAKKPHAYDIDMQLSASGKVLAAPRLTISEGSKASISERADSGDIFLEITAQEASPNKGILMQFAYGTVGASGERKVLARPQLIALENFSSELKFDSEGEPLRLRVTARQSTF
jgi:hypothetical protein